MTKFKGPSFGAQNTEPATRQQWISHNGKRQRIKYLRMACKSILNSKDPKVKDLIERAKAYAAGPFQEYGMLMTIHQAKEIEDSTGSPFDVNLEYILEKLEDEKSSPAVADETSSGEGGVDPNRGESDVSRAGDEVAREASGQAPPPTNDRPINQIVVEEENENV